MIASKSSLRRTRVIDSAGCLFRSAGRATLHGKASLQIDPVRSEDQGWYECRVLMLEQQYDTFHNGSWVHLTVNGESPVHSVHPLSHSVGVQRGGKKQKEEKIYVRTFCGWH